MEILSEQLDKDCVVGCNGSWLEKACETLERNNIERNVFGKAVVLLIEKGRGKFRNILITGPANCGKTFILKPLNEIYTMFVCCLFLCIYLLLRHI